MGKLIRNIIVCYFFFILPSNFVMSGELITFECVDGEFDYFVVDADGGNQNVSGYKVNAILTKEKLILNFLEEDFQLLVDLESGQMYESGTKTGICKVSNVEVLETPSPQLGVACMITESSSKPDIWFSGITSGTFNKSDYEKEGTLSVTATVSGNNNTAKFSTQTSYKKIGNRLEINKVWLTVAATMEQFNEHFGLFPDLKCTSP